MNSSLKEEYDYETRFNNISHYELIFNKPPFELGFIITHENFESIVQIYQNHFQKKYKLTTHCIYIKDISKINQCLTELKTHHIYYIIVINEINLLENCYDFYLLQSNEKAMRSSIEKIEILLSQDFKNLMNIIKVLRNNSLKSLHLQENENELNDELRYYLCLLFDNRILNMKELKLVHRFLLNKKIILEKEAFSALQCDNRRISFYEPGANFNIDKGESSIIGDQEVKKIGSLLKIEGLPSTFQPSRFIFAGPHKTGTVVQVTNQPNTGSIIYYDRPSSLSKNSEKDRDLSCSDQKWRFRPLKRQRSKASPKSTRGSLKESKINRINIAEIIYLKAYSKLDKIKPIKTNIGKVLKIELIIDRVKVNFNKRLLENVAEKMNYNKSSYNLKSAYQIPSENFPSSHQTIKNMTTVKSEADYQSHWPLSLALNSSGRIQESSQFSNLIKLNEESHFASVSVDQNNFHKRKLSPEINLCPQKLRKSNVSPPSPVDTTVDMTKNKISSNIKSSPDHLLNLFRLILSLVPLELPNENAVYKVISNSCLIIQEGIKEPTLKNVKINYDICKNNGLSEIVSNIYSIFNETEKAVRDPSYMVFIWNKYFPNKLSNYNMLVLFYKFVKLLMLYTVFNRSIEMRKLVATVIENVDVIVWFDLNNNVMSGLSSENLLHFTNSFDTYFKIHDQLHVLYSNMPNPDPLPPADKRKKLDEVIKRKKLEFIFGPILRNFVRAINLIGRKMQPVQMEIVYGAIRTLRFCLRTINPKLVQSIFNKPKSFEFSFNTDLYCYYNDEILKELKFLLKEIKHYQCVLFTEMHYEFVNCVLDFSCMIDGNTIVSSGSAEDIECNYQKTSLMFIDPDEFIDNFSSFDSPILLEYHPESELEFMISSLRTHWTEILHQAFIGTLPEPCGRRIIKEINILLPDFWGFIIFSEAVVNASKLYYETYQKMAIIDPLDWFGNFLQGKSCAIHWLTKYHLPLTNLEVLHNFQIMLENQL